MNTNSKNNSKLILTIVLIAIFCIGGILAYLTASHTLTNSFSIADKLEVKVIEEQWDAAPDDDGDGIPNYAENMEPGKTIVKDPAVENKSNTPVWVMVEVEVPRVLKTMTAGKDGQILNGTTEEETVDLFIFETNPEWELMGEGYDDPDMLIIAEPYAVHHYYYMLKTPLEKGKSATLFDNITYTNVQSEYMTATEDYNLTQQMVNISTKVIQSSNFDTYEKAFLKIGPYCKWSHPRSIEPGFGEIVKCKYGEDIKGKPITIEYWSYTDSNTWNMNLVHQENVYLNDLFNSGYNQNMDYDPSNDYFLAGNCIGWYDAEGINCFLANGEPITIQDIVNALKDVGIKTYKDGYIRLYYGF